MHRLERVWLYFAPVVSVVGSFIPMHRGLLLRIAVLGILGSGFNAVGYLALAPLIDHAIKGTENLILGPVVLAGDEKGVFTVVAVAIMFVVSSLLLSYRVHLCALKVLHRTAIEAALRGLLVVNSRNLVNKYSRIVNEVTGPVAFACGFAMHLLAKGLSEALQFFVFLGLLFWLSPGMTLAFLLCFLVAGVYFFRSMTAITTTVSETRERAATAREEMNDIGKSLKQASLPELELRERIEHLHQEGATGKLLENKLNLRRETKRGPLFIESLYPVALIIFPALALTTGNLQNHLGPIIIYIIVLRRVIGVLQRLAGLLISVGRYHPLLICHADLTGGAPYPRCSASAMLNDSDGETP